jgi:hypothetical protein
LSAAEFRKFFSGAARVFFAGRNLFFHQREQTAQLRPQPPQFIEVNR